MTPILGLDSLAAPMTSVTEIEFRPTPFDEGDAAVLVQAYHEEIAVIYDGLDLNSSNMPPAGAAQFGAPHGTFLVGYQAGEPICCGGVKRLDEHNCELKRMYVVPHARGRGVARRLLSALEHAASQLGYTTARLATGPRQPGAQHLYLSTGYVVIGNFNDEPAASFFGEKPLR
jgi:GNAT superfamily N-acetyltransferase